METESLQINISDHAYERYAERVRNADDHSEVRELLSKYKDKYTQEIEKLFASSNLYYEGLFGKNAKDNVGVYINNGGWVLLVGNKSNCIITLYKPDLNVGDPDFNKEFIKKSILKIEQEKINYADAKEKCMHQKEELGNQISLLKEKVDLMKQTMDGYKKQIEGLEIQKQGLDAIVKENQLKYREAVEDFCIKDKLK